VPARGSAPSAREWARLVTPGGLDAGPWFALKPVGAATGHQRRQGADPDTAIGSASTASASTGGSLWDGFIPDPVYPDGHEPDGLPQRAG
jgi:hypothetical protein